jgi:hypothetical protein
MKACVFMAFLAGWLCVITPVAAYAGVPQYPQKRGTASSHATMRKAPKGPKQDHVHRGGVDGSITLIQLVSTRRQHEKEYQGQNQATPHGSLAQVRASWELAEPGNSGSSSARAVESHPPYWGSTHLSI